MSNNEEKKNPKNKNVTSTSPKRELDPVRQANIDWINASSMSEKNKKKTLAFIDCDPQDIHLYCKGVPGVPKVEK